MAAPLRYDSKHPETWTSFLRRIKNYIASKGAIADGQRKGIILDALDDATLDRLDRWLVPINVDDAPFDYVMETPRVNMATPVNSTAQYIVFTARRQQSGESVLAFHEALSVLAATLGIADLGARDTLVMHQFIAGLADQSLQDRILDFPECSLGKAVDTAAQHEATLRSAAVLRADGVYRVGGPSAPMQCFFCAGPHVANNCKADRSKLFCTKCKTKGHVAEVCKGGPKKRPAGQPAKPKDGPKTVEGANFVAAANQGPPACNPVPAQVHAAPASTPCCAHAHIHDHEGLFFLSADAAVPPPDMVVVGVQGRELQFQLDNGAGRTMVSYDTYLRLPDYPPLRPIPTALRGWQQSMVIDVAWFCGVQVSYKGSCHTLPLLVARGDGPNLLGRNWFKPLGFAVVEVENVAQVQDGADILHLVRQYPAVSARGIGCYNAPPPPPVHVHVDPAKTPRYHSARAVKLPLIPKMEDQIDAYDESAHILAVNTIKGLHKVTRLPFGVKIAPVVFQRIMDGLFGGVDGVVVYQDNIHVRSASLAEHRRRLHVVLTKLSDAGFTVNAEKCTWLASELNVLGFKVSREGVHPREDKVDAIKRAPAPRNVAELQSWLGLVSFYERFFQGKSHVLEPLHRLLDAGSTWSWGPREQQALDAVKELISSDAVLVHYDLNKPVTVVTLSATERRYSQLDLEALAVMFAVRKFSRYLYGRKFLIVTDHKPLVSLFDPTSPIGDHLSPRMTRWALALSALDYRIVHRPGADIGHADFLSRLPLPSQGDQPMYPEPAGVFLLQAKTPDILTAESGKDLVIRDVMTWVNEGWPSVVPPEAAPYFQKRNSLSIHRGCLLQSDRVVVPESLRAQVLELVHAAHPGSVASKAIARSIVWWPKWCTDVEDIVRRCTACQLEAKMTPKKPYRPWPALERCRQRVHLDYAGPFLGHYFLVAVDAFSKWTVVKLMSSLSSAALIAHSKIQSG
ncbi:hypothetical protein ONE63_007346 [Megalurothrips usitatus]|uniref:RNA-directed DNA polymerase n=1 Tax=Megalurothrips usitatus TaxID=439358 RepID=A0AAV7XVW5_9NEOP|nr:hypothetical protein ONE63_007346 [Megalurothrips usitatus]